MQTAFHRRLLGNNISRIRPGGGGGDQKMGGALLEFPMRTAMHGKSRVSSAISVQ